jgi:upstream activation factor subunit UAF30
MPKQSKTKTTTDVVETATVPVVNTVIDVAAVEKVKKVKAPKVKAETVVAETTVQTAATTTSVTDVVETADVESDLTAQSTEFLAKLSQLSTLLASLKVEYRTLEKRWVRELKTAQKSQAKRKRKSGNRAPSGFVKPTKISDELAKFLEKPVGSEMARTDVTREINTYIRKHNLQDKENGRKINPDAKLQTLLKLKKTDELTYFNLQRYMSPHFSKAVKEVVA